MSTDKTKPHRESDPKPFDPKPGIWARPSCDCYLHEHQVCDICQGTGGKDVKPKAETPKPETQATTPIGTPSFTEQANPNAVTFEETQAGAMEAFSPLRMFVHEIVGNGVTSREYDRVEALIAARDARRDANAAVSYRKLFAHYESKIPDAQKIGETVALREAAKIKCEFCRTQGQWNAESDMLWKSGPAIQKGTRFMHFVEDKYGSINEDWCCSEDILALIPSDGQSLVDKHDAEIRAELRKRIDQLEVIVPSELGPDEQWNRNGEYISKDAVMALIPAQASNAAGGK
jgi:hypothetical protein